MSTDHLQQIPNEERGRFSDKQTGDRIHQHLNNELDEITEEDIRNVRTDIGVDKTPADERVPLPVENAQAELTKKDKVKNNSDPDVVTPWNILES